MMTMPFPSPPIQHAARLRRRCIVGGERRRKDVVLTGVRTERHIGYRTRSVDRVVPAVPGVALVGGASEPGTRDALHVDVAEITAVDLGDPETVNAPHEVELIEVPELVAVDSALDALGRRSRGRDARGQAVDRLTHGAVTTRRDLEAGAVHDLRHGARVTIHVLALLGALNVLDVDAAVGDGLVTRVERLVVAVVAVAGFGAAVMILPARVDRAGVVVEALRVLVAQRAADTAVAPELLGVAQRLELAGLGLPVTLGDEAGVGARAVVQATGGDGVVVAVAGLGVALVVRTRVAVVAARPVNSLAVRVAGVLRARIVVVRFAQWARDDRADLLALIGRTHGLEEARVQVIGERARVRVVPNDTRQRIALVDRARVVVVDVLALVLEHAAASHPAREAGGANDLVRGLAGSAVAELGRTRVAVVAFRVDDAPDAVVGRRRVALSDRGRGGVVVITASRHRPAVAGHRQERQERQERHSPGTVSRLHVSISSWFRILSVSLFL